MENLVTESLYEYHSQQYHNPWESWKDAVKYIIDILEKNPKLTLHQLVGQCRGWVSHMSDQSRNNFNRAIDELEKMNS
jgi:hypothetical protein